IYSASVEKVRDRIRFARQIMDENGYEKAESILNEWNYVRGWHDEDWIYSLKMEKGLKGSAFVASVMEMAQGEPLDNLMYYDARPCAMNGMFSTDYVCDRLKGYYPFWMFNRLYQLGTSVPVITDGNIWATAAKGENGAMAVMLTHYCDDDATPAEQVSLALENLGARRVRVRYYLLDGSHDGEAVWEEAVQTDAISVSLKMPLFSTWLVEITPE
ncbi:MAG: hypothetical protein IKD01_05540, partial [Oscillospiraceae bacterium]|nr:hypothetical protein [Oscillospiraceae bacterium]